MSKTTEQSALDQGLAFGTYMLGVESVMTDKMTHVFDEGSGES